jgi:hypothetical protein
MSQEIAALQKQASEALQMLMKIEKKEGAKSEQHKKIKAKYTELAKEIQRQTLAPQGPGDGVIMDVASITLKDKATKDSRWEGRLRLTTQHLIFTEDLKSADNLRPLQVTPPRHSPAASSRQERL